MHGIKHSGPFLRSSRVAKTRFPWRPRGAKVMAMKPVTLALASILYFAGALHGSAAEPKFVPLFNGKDLTNFKAEDSKAFWRVENGILIGENDAAKKGNYLWTQKSYGDFVIEFDVRWKS